MSEENLYTFENPEYRSTYWHTCSHILAQAMKRLHPEVKLAIGPSIENGFYYDFDREKPFLQEDLDRYNSFFSPSQAAEGDVLFTDLLVSWHIQEVVIPLTPVEDNGFDPMDETSEQLKDIVNKVA